MKLSAMREAIKAAYPNKTWWRKVDEMEDRRVVAIYRNLKDQDKVK